MPEDRAYSLFCFMLIPFFLFGFIVFLFPFVVEDPDGIAAIITKAEKYKTNVSSYEQFLSMAQESLGGDGFARVQEQAFAEYQMTLKKVFTQQWKRIANKVIKKAKIYTAKAIGTGVAEDVAYSAFYNFASWFSTNAIERLVGE